MQRPRLLPSANLTSAAVFLALLASAWASGKVAGEDAGQIDQRLAATAKYLSSDELEGRGLGSQGLDAAANYLADEFKRLGLKTDIYDGSPFQVFKVTISSTLGARNTLAFVGPQGDQAGTNDSSRIELKLGQEFNPLSLGGSAKFDLPLVFVGYGITAKNEKYDDYAGVDVKDKAVVILRHEPQQANPHSVFNGSKHSEYAPFSRKISNAYEHGAAAVIFCTDQFDIDSNVSNLEKRWQAALDELAAANARFKAIEKPKDNERQAYQIEVKKQVSLVQSLTDQLELARDPLLPFEGAGFESEGRNFPVLFCRRSAIEPVIKAALDRDLATLEAEIDKGPEPRSAALTGWRVSGETSVVRKEADVKNVVAVLDGDGTKADETIVIGAHYDHLGFGGPNSAAQGVREIHNGADDNASGATVLLEVARELASREKKLPRRIVFVSFTGEERGLLGSAYYVRHPLVPIASTVAMLNMDMVGRLKDEKLIVHGTGTAPEFDPLVDRLGKEHDFKIKKEPGGFGPSDHSSFYGAKVPVLHFFTGSHKDYHRPSDDFEKLNIAGMRRVGQAVAEAAQALAEAEVRPLYQETKSPAMLGGGDRPYFGSIPDFGQDEPGYALAGVTKDSPAERAGIRAGDIIVQFGESKIGNLEDFDSALRKHKAGEKVPAIVKRDKKDVKVEVLLEPPR